MKTCRVFLSLLLAAAFAVPAQAEAQTACGKRNEIVKMLSDKYRETPRALGIAGQTNLLEVYTSKSGSWTLLLTQPRGRTCIVGAGQSWEELPDQKKLTGL